LIKYRPEIDGLRAIAVLSVILYHASFAFYGFNSFKGGFIGVDIFFVISGYLIASILLRELKSNHFTFKGFYERRARRILPALFFVMFVTVPFAWMHMFQKAFTEYGYSIAASTVFGSNIYFWKQDSYTALPSAFKPFLHTWSLSVEEQFYLLFPIALLLCWKYARKYITAIFLAGFIVSLIYAERISRVRVNEAFFLLPARGWELLAGALLAKFESEKGRSAHDLLYRLMPALGLILISYSVIRFDDQMRYPSHLTLIPILGVVLVIWFSGKEDLVTRLLSSKMFVAVGLISYSLYLWHQPIFAFIRITSSKILTENEKLLGLALTFVLAIVTWGLVERPFRNKATISTNVLWKSLSATALALFVFGILNAKIPVFSGQRVFGNLKLDAVRGNAHYLGRECQGDYLPKICIIGDLEVTPTYALLGDSHALTISGPLGEILKAHHKAAYSYTFNGCPFIENVLRRSDNRPCDVQTEDVFKMLKEKNIKNIIVLDRRSAYILGTGFDNQEGGVEYSDPLIFAKGKGLKSSSRIEDLIELQNKTTERVLGMGIKVFYILPVPEVGYNVPYAIKNMRSIRELPLTTSRSLYFERNKVAFELVDKFQNNKNFVAIHPDETFCSEKSGRCVTHDDKYLFYEDTDHLSIEGGTKFVKAIEPIILDSQKKGSM